MKRILLSLTALCAAVSLNAQQTLVNGDFEGTMEAIPGFTYTHSLDGWGALINGGPETADVSQGTQAAKLETISDAALQGALGTADPEIAGYMSQSYEGAFTDVANMTITFDYKATVAGSTADDQPYIQVTVIDTMAAGNTDDVTLYYDFLDIASDVTTWTSNTFSMNSTGETGTANKMTFTAVSSAYGVYAAGTPTVGGVLWLDNIQVVGGGTTSINENEVSALVYPNPAADVLNIELNEVATSVSVVSLDGKVVISESVNSSNVSVDVSNLVQGAYVYVIETANGTVRNTFVKK